MSQTDLRDRARNGGQRADRPTAAVALRDRDPVALAAAREYQGEFTALLPTHVDVETFVHLAQNALRRDDKLMDVAKRNPASFIHALREAARLGHEPGTSAFYLTPRFGKDPQVLGIEGYRGVIERIYRAGAVSSVKVELVRERDEFRYDPGYDDRPQHRVSWFSDRGPIVGAYAYAVMVDGSISKVVVVDQERIDRAKKASSTADKTDRDGNPTGPWATDYGAMVLKTAAHALEPWVPTSSEYRKEQMRAAAAVAREDDARRTIEVPAAPLPAQAVHAPPGVNLATGEVVDDSWPEPAPIPNGVQIEDPEEYGDAS